ncbi:MAG: NAD-glutamate dehydrogenase, partial [Rickettsiales bacterium]|nr:NAD-glutamate dehydrogenase [Rickettsiales bacterium]
AQIESQVRAMMSDSAAKAFEQTTERLQALKVPAALAKRMAMLEVMTAACDIADAAKESKLPLTTVGRVYFELGAVLKLGWLRQAANDLTAENYWQQLAVKSLAVEFYQAQRRLTLAILAQYGKHTDASGAWLAANGAAINRYDAFIGDLRAQATFDYPMLIVALRQVQGITSL